MAKDETLFIDLYAVPKEWNVGLAKLGIRWAMWEAQPIADQIKITGCTNVPKELPPWIRRA